MKITINDEVLKKEHLSIGELLILLLGYYDINYDDCCSKLIDKHIASINVFNPTSIVLSDNSRNLVAKILMESNDKVRNSGIDFMELATKLQAIYPPGNKPSTTYTWRGKTEEIAQKLRILVAQYDFSFTEEEAINATKQYVESFEKAEKHMRLLKYFILKTGSKEDIDSMFMTLIENNRDESNTK